MKKILLFLLPLYLVLTPLIIYFLGQNSNSKSVGAPPYEVSGNVLGFDIDNISSFVNWERPDSPAKVGLQVGHWKTDEAPDEQERLRGNHGASGGGKSEWEVNMEIANMTAQILRERDILVEILPTTIPPDFWADAFISIHADGNENQTKSGFKAATPWRDMSGKAENLLAAVEDSYQNSTNMVIDPNVTRNMRGYYAFRWWRFEHAIHPMTPAIILETGFLSSPEDRRIIVDRPELSAQGLADGIIQFLESEDLIES